MMIFKFGFYYKNVLFVWHEKKLYQYPYSSNGKYFPLREKPLNKKRNMYRICRDWKSYKQLEAITVAVKVEPIFVSKGDDLPF